MTNDRGNDIPCPLCGRDMTYKLGFLLFISSFGQPMDIIPSLLIGSFLWLRVLLPTHFDHVEDREFRLS